jgi:hypothetical protein
MNSKNPPPANLEKASHIAQQNIFIRILGVLGIGFGIAICYRNATIGVLEIILAAIAVITSFSKTKIRQLESMLPLFPWDQGFDIPTHRIELAFQMSSGHDNSNFLQRLIVAVKMALQQFNEDTLKLDIEKAVTRDVDELGIQVFRVHVLNKIPLPAHISAAKSSEQQIYTFQDLILSYRLNSPNVSVVEMEAKLSRILNAHPGADLYALAKDLGITINSVQRKTFVAEQSEDDVEFPLE